MIKGVKRERITTDAILDKISEYDIYKYYMPNNNWSVGEATYSPFRRENNPSFLISMRNDKLTYIDFADVDKSGDCFNFVMQLHNIHRFYDALVKIDSDFNLGLSSGTTTTEYKRIIQSYPQPKLENKEAAFIQVKTRPFTNQELAYWNEYYQDIEDLKANNIYSVAEVYLNKKKFIVPDNELRFGYLYDGKWKIYRPFSDKKTKWMPNNVPATAMDGLDDIKDCNVAFINKSKKDYMVMKKIYPHCCAVQNEGVGCFSYENVQYLKDNSNRQILSFDSDTVGVKSSKMITEMFGFEYCNVPKHYLSEGIKDWADLAKAHGLKVIEEYLINKNIIQ
jgi:DNA primase